MIDIDKTEVDGRLLGDLENSSVWGSIGSTPLVDLSAIAPEPVRILGKLESANPGGSIKDRVAQSMLRKAVLTGRITRESTIVESSSGNTGIGLAMLCAVAGLRMTAVVDRRTTAAHLGLLRAYGARVVLVSEPDPVSGEFLPARLAKVREILASDSTAFWPDQYKNPAVLEAHTHGTMREIAAQILTPPDYLYVPASTCGTLAGCSIFLRENQWPTRLVAVDVQGSKIFCDHHSDTKRTLPGLGAPFEPPFRQLADVWRAEHVSESECVRSCNDLARTSGILVGASSGGVISAARRLASESPSGSTHVLILPDRGERYLDSVYASTDQVSSRERINHD